MPNAVSEFAPMCESFKTNLIWSRAATDRKWVTDVTYVAVGGSWVYVVVSWSISDSLATPLVIDALRNAEYRRSDTTQLMHHSD